MGLIETVALNYPEKVGMKSPPPMPLADPVASDSDDEELVDHALAPDGTRLTLRCRNNEYGIQVDGWELMSTEARSSEEALARLSCAPLADRADSKILIGGLGMGFTLRETLDVLPADARVTVIEVVAAVVDWNRRYLRDRNGDPLADPRVTVVVSDIVPWVRESTETFDAILLDVDNGPEQLAFASNQSLYTIDGLEMLKARLQPSGVLAIWSGARVRQFEARLDEAGLRTETHAIAAAIPGGPDHTVYVVSHP
jgi:spermidine synthase